MNGTVEVVFFAPEENVEQRLLKDRGYLLQRLQASPLVGVPWRRKPLSLLGLSRSVVRARSMLRAAGVEVVLGFGGYASVALVTAAWSLGLRTAIFESNWSPGLANRILGRLVDRVYLMHHSAQADFPAGRCVVIGSPVRPDVAALGAEQRRLPPDAGRVRVLVTGGSLGSSFLNDRAPELLSLLQREGIGIEVYHQTGRGDAKLVRERYQREGVSARTTSYIEDIASAYRWADFAIACAGAATLSELATAGIPVLLVPALSAARNHQLPNARVFAETTECLWVTEGDWDTEALSRAIAPILRSPQEWLKASRGMRRAATPSAVDALVADWCGFLGRQAPAQARK
jgi:UDP-N-acetylglucosamine--N-acetylmuramyl-(pentapeptide) pyrophosphoryl-undecaprenol N-acetylglucosamine transferase